jgi:hypothetical protein
MGLAAMELSKILKVHSLLKFCMTGGVLVPFDLTEAHKVFDLISSVSVLG